MEKLLVYKEDKNKFSLETLERKLLTADGVSNLISRFFADTPLRLDYEFARQTVTVRLADDLETFIIEGSNDTSLLFALKLQEIESSPLRMFNNNYDFHFSMEEINSLKNLK